MWFEYPVLVVSSFDGMETLDGMEKRREMLSIGGQFAFCTGLTEIQT